METDDIVEKLDNGYTVIIEAREEGRPLELIGNVDVEVVSDQGNRSTATFFTPENIVELMKRYESTGECLNGRYFCCSDMILVRKLDVNHIVSTIQDLMKTGEFEWAFDHWPIDK